MNKKSRVRALIKRSQRILGLDAYTLEVVFPKSDPVEDVDADIEVVDKYLCAKITIYPRFFKLLKREQLDTIAHELCHIYFGRLEESVVDSKEWDDSAEEQTVERISRVVRRLL